MFEFAAYVMLWLTSVFVIHEHSIFTNDSDKDRVVTAVMEMKLIKEEYHHCYTSGTLAQ